MRAGTACADITPSERIGIAGQMNLRYGDYTHDPLTVNAVAFEAGETRVVLVSCDLLVLPDELVRAVQAECENACGLPARSLILACTHTHTAPYTGPLVIADAEPFFLDMLRLALVDVAKRALDDLEAVELYAGTGWLEQMGFNRRGYHKDGTVDMYHGCWNDDFAGLEGPRDGEVGVIFGRRPGGSLKFVIPSFSTHATVLGGESYYSADVAGAVRDHLRKNLGEDLGVVYLTGAAGNTAPVDLESDDKFSGPWLDEEGWKRSGLYLGSEIVKVVAATTRPMLDPVLRLAQSSIPIAIREYEEFEPPSWAAEYYSYCKNDWPRLMREESPVDVRLSVLRLGDAAICTSPAEYYVEYGLAIKDQSPARVTIISELTDGYVGYVATPEAMKHGGYSAFPGLGSKLVAEAGDMIAQATVELLKDVFAQG